MSEDLLQMRRSVRSFRSTSVPQPLLEEILGQAALAPSWANTQPWEVVMVGGNKLAELGDAFCSHLEAEEPPQPDFPMPGHAWPYPYQERITALAMKLFAQAGIARGDREARLAHYRRMYRAFGAPHLALVCLDSSLTFPYPLLDAGAFVQTLCLAAAGRGLGTCILAAVARYPDTARRVLALPPEKKVVVGVALGYADEESPYNRFRSEREPLASFVTWRS